MCEKKVARLTGMPAHQFHSSIDHLPQREVVIAHMTEREIEDFVRNGERHLIGKKG
jgi:hypothetical protein